MPTKPHPDDSSGDDRVRTQPGVGVDIHGGPLIDPTRNVLDLVRAESKYQDGMRTAQGQVLDGKLNGLREVMNVMSHGIEAYQNALRDAETRRIDELARTRQEFQNTIRDMLAESVRTTSTLVSTQLVQIQATFDTRVSKLEQARWEVAGRSSVADPATSEALARFTAETRALRVEQDAIRTAQSGAGGALQGRADANTALNRTIMAVVAVAGLIFVALAYMAGKGGHLP